MHAKYSQIIKECTAAVAPPYNLIERGDSFILNNNYVSSIEARALDLVFAIYIYRLQSSVRKQRGAFMHG